MFWELTPSLLRHTSLLPDLAESSCAPSRWAATFLVLLPLLLLGNVGLLSPDWLV